MQKRKAKPPQIVENQLYDNETLLWWDKPAPLPYTLRNMRKIDLFSGLIALFAITYMSQMIGNMPPAPMMGDMGLPVPFSLFFNGIMLFIFVFALWQVLNPLRHYLEATRTTYALTDQRALIISEMLSTRVESYFEKHIEKLEVSVGSGGTGDIIFDTDLETRESRSQHGGMRRYTVKINRGFFGVADVRYVEDLMSQVFFSEGAMTGKQKPKRDTVPDDNESVTLSNLLDDDEHLTDSR